MYFSEGALILGKYPFGYGLSYTTFEYGLPAYSDGRLTVDVTNTGEREGTEIVQAYMRRVADVKGPNKSLRGYERVNLMPGETRTVVIDLPESSFENWDESTATMRVVPGDYELMVGPSSDSASLQTIYLTLQ